MVNTELAQEMRRIGMRYTRRDCVKLCEQKQIIDQFGCYSLAFPKIFNFPPCPYQIDPHINMTECIELCPHECKSTSYDLSISYGEYPTRKYMKDLSERFETFKWAFKTDLNNSKYNFDSLELARASLVKIFVYFEDIKYTKISEAPTMTFVDLIASIGGTLGLFIGISLLSFVELIELIVEIVGIFWVNYNFSKQNI